MKLRKGKTFKQLKHGDGNIPYIYTTKNQTNMQHKLIKTENYLLVVDKLNCPAKEGQTFLTKEGLIHTNIGWNYGDSVIIYHLPLNNAPILEGVDLLPPLEDDGDLIYENTEDSFYKKYDDALHYYSFIEGYNKAKEKYNYTEEDMFMLAAKVVNDIAKNRGNSHWNMFTTPKMIAEEFIQSLQQPKYPDAFESTIGVCSKWLAEQCDNNCCGQPEKIKTITNSNGQTQLVGTYIYE
jgi:hypothetical protein